MVKHYKIWLRVLNHETLLICSECAAHDCPTIDTLGFGVQRLAIGQRLRTCHITAHLGLAAVETFG